MVRLFTKYKLVGALIVSAMIFVCGGFLWAYAALSRAGGFLIVHFDDIRGITTAHGTGKIVFAGVFGILIVFINGFLAVDFDERNNFFGKLIAAMTLAFAILLFIAFAAILSVN